MTARKLLASALAVTVTGVTIALAAWPGGATGADPDTAAAPPPHTTTVQRRDLVQTEEVSGELGYGDPEPLPNLAQGVVTWLPEPGTVLRPGDVAYRIGEQPVVVMPGAVPAHRAMAYGTEGDDVRQLQEYLVAAGFAGFEPDGDFGSATRRAVRDWQDSLGVDDTGRVDQGAVVFVDGAVRVAETTRPGTAATEAVLQVTSPEQRIDVRLDPGLRDLVDLGDEVDVELPDDSVVTGRVASVGDVVESDGNGTATLAMTVTLSQGAAWEGAPVEVALVRSAAESVLAVPVPALLALAEGGFALEKVAADGSTSLVAVDAGASADGWVAVTGDIAEGDVVVVAA